jgi:hypothetical protein
MSTPKKVKPAVSAEIDGLSAANRSMRSAVIATIIRHTNGFPTMPRATVDRAGQELRFRFL